MRRCAVGMEHHAGLAGTGHMEVAERSEAEQAKDHKEAGNTCYKAAQYARAIDEYGKAIGSCVGTQPSP